MLLYCTQVLNAFNDVTLSGIQHLSTVQQHIVIYYQKQIDILKELVSSEISYDRTRAYDINIAQLVGHWTSKPKVVGSNPIEARQIFQPVWCGYILRVTSLKDFKN